MHLPLSLVTIQIQPKQELGRFFTFFPIFPKFKDFTNLFTDFSLSIKGFPAKICIIVQTCMKTSKMNYNMKFLKKMLEVNKISFIDFVSKAK